MRAVLVIGVCAVLLSGCGIIDGASFDSSFNGPSTADQQQTQTTSQQPAPAYAQPAYAQPAYAYRQPAMTARQRQAAKDDAICRSYGTYPGTTPYVQCRLGLRSMDQGSDESPFDSLFGN